MGLIPRTKTAKVDYFNAHLTPWTTNAVAIGTTAAAVTDLSTKVGVAQDKLAAQFAAEQAYKTAVMAADNAIAVMVDAGSDIIKSIRAKAAVSGAAIYELAQIPDPAIPQPVSTLGQPTDFKVLLGGDGRLTLKWKCASPRGTGMIYQVWRSLNGGADFAYAGGTGSKTFVDGTLPTGLSSVVYKVQAVRSTAAGPWATFTVLIGTTSGGQMTASLVQQRLAA